MAAEADFRQSTGEVTLFVSFEGKSSGDLQQTGQLGFELGSE
jgi:hypothetical protein